MEEKKTTLEQELELQAKLKALAQAEEEGIRLMEEVARKVEEAKARQGTQG